MCVLDQDSASDKLDQIEVNVGAASGLVRPSAAEVHPQSEPMVVVIVNVQILDQVLDPESRRVQLKVAHLVAAMRAGHTAAEHVPRARVVVHEPVAVQVLHVFGGIVEARVLDVTARALVQHHAQLVRRQVNGGHMEGGVDGVAQVLRAHLVPHLGQVDGRMVYGVVAVGEQRDVYVPRRHRSGQLAED